LERLYQVICLGILGALYVVSPRTAVAGDFCSLTVRVISPNGSRPVAPITVREKSGRAEEKDQEDSDVPFCDLGILPVTVTVGSAGLCNQVTVRDVPLTMGDTYVLVVTYDPFACSQAFRTPTCKTLFRVDDSGGKWVKDARISLSKPMPTALSTDGYGRASFVAGYGAQVRGTVLAPSFKPVEFDWTCSRLEPIHEQLITIEKR
jgi:hypothetical protein